VTGVAEKEDRVSLAMTRQERETFLADVHVGVISIADEGRGLLAVPIWYTYEPGGELRVVTARASRKGRLLAHAGRFSLCAQTETPPYQYVSVEGPIMATEAADLERDLRPLAHRYLGIEMGDRYIEQTRDAHEHAENVRIRMRPERWLTVDFAKAFGAL
jgi:nitroimidazol reductase NimA-like FMN-containing flavoprotein (pyridoxamine 5'-phosphate oxidase superfamily)